jgi:hypothetical protein
MENYGEQDGNNRLQKISYRWKGENGKKVMSSLKMTETEGQAWLLGNAQSGNVQVCVSLKIWKGATKKIYKIPI